MFDLPKALYVICSVPYHCPHDVPTKALRMLFLFGTLSLCYVVSILVEWYGGALSRTQHFCTLDQR